MVSELASNAEHSELHSIQSKRYESSSNCSRLRFGSNPNSQRHHESSGEDEASKLLKEMRLTDSNKESNCDKAVSADLKKIRMD